MNKMITRFAFLSCAHVIDRTEQKILIRIQRLYRLSHSETDSKVIFKLELQNLTEFLNVVWPISRNNVLYRIPYVVVN